jgi:hypothetical protein
MPDRACLYDEEQDTPSGIPPLLGECYSCSGLPNCLLISPSSHRSRSLDQHGPGMVLMLHDGIFFQLQWRKTCIFSTSLTHQSPYLSPETLLELIQEGIDYRRFPPHDPLPYYLAFRVATTHLFHRREGLVFVVLERDSRNCLELEGNRSGSGRLCGQRQS